MLFEKKNRKCGEVVNESKVHGERNVCIFFVVLFLNTLNLSAKKSYQLVFLKYPYKKLICLHSMSHIVPTFLTTLLDSVVTFLLFLLFTSVVSVSDIVAS